MHSEEKEFDPNCSQCWLEMLPYLLGGGLFGFLIVVVLCSALDDKPKSAATYAPAAAPAPASPPYSPPTEKRWDEK
jgi:hypothetical protein